MDANNKSREVALSQRGFSLPTGIEPVGKANSVIFPQEFGCSYLTGTNLCTRSPLKTSPV